MGIFDEVFGRKIEGDGGGLFSDKYKAERDIIHDPLPASAYVDVLKKNDELRSENWNTIKQRVADATSDAAAVWTAKFLFFVDALVPLTD